MEASLFFLFALFSVSYAQYMSSWGSSQGYTNQMQMPYGSGHMPYHHGYREASVESIPIGPSKGDGILPIQMFRAKLPSSRIGLQDYSLLNVNPSDHEDMTDHVVFRQSMGDVKRPVVGVLSLLSAPLPLAMNSMPSLNQMGNLGGKANPNYPDPSSADEMMTCVGMEMAEPLKVHSAEPRIIINRGIPYFTQSMHKIK